MKGIEGRGSYARGREVTEGDGEGWQHDCLAGIFALYLHAR